MQMLSSAGSSTTSNKRRSRAWDPQAMNAEVFETPDPEVTFQPYAAVHSGHGSSLAPEDSGATTAAHYDRANMELDEQAVLPNHAFEVFMGKVYKPTPLAKQTEFEASTSSATSFAASNKPLESPLQRFTRLSLEMQELERDLSLLAESATKAKLDATVVVDAAQDAECSEIMRGLATLQLNLLAVEQNASFQPFLAPTSSLSSGQASAAAALQRELTSKFFSQIDALKKQQHQQQPHPHSATGSGSSVQAPIVYEIYSNGELNAVDRDAKTRVLALESRLTMLEKIIGATNPKQLHVDGLRMSSTSSSASGSGSSNSNSDLSLATLIEELDRRVGMLSEKNLDAIKSRTAALVSEFSQLQKLKDSPSVQSALATQADRDKIQQIYEQLNSVQDVAASVPALVDRLVTLKSVHDESLDLSARVQKIEKSQGVLSELLETDASLLANIEQSLQANVQIFQANIQTLDERMTHLLNSRQQQ